MKIKCIDESDRCKGKPHYSGLILWEKFQAGFIKLPVRILYGKSKELERKGCYTKISICVRKASLQMQKGMVSMIEIYVAAHFLVDLACAYLMFSGIYGAENWYICLLLYNFCAFAMQMPIGLLADYKNRNAYLAVWGCVLVAAAFLPGAAVSLAARTGAAGTMTDSIGLWAAGTASIVAGLGNGLFHVGGGLDVLNKSNKSAGLLGFFVAPGALGIYLGTALGKGRGWPEEWPALLLLPVAFGIYWCARRKGIWQVSGNAPFSLFPDRKALAGAWKQATAAVLCLFFVVVLRSYLGMIQDFIWKESMGAGMILVCAAALGKFAGGFLADIAGFKKTAVLSLIVSGGLHLLSFHPAAGILAVFFWNMTMPLTLWAVARLMPGAKGFSFGLLTFGLFLGFCPPYLKISAFTDLFPTPELGLGLLCGISLALFQGGMYYAGKYFHGTVDISRNGNFPRADNSR